MCFLFSPHSAATGLTFNHLLAWLPKLSALQQVTSPELQLQFAIIFFYCMR